MSSLLSGIFLILCQTTVLCTTGDVISDQICIIGKLEYLWNKKNITKRKTPFYSTLQSLLNECIFNWLIFRVICTLKFDLTTTTTTIFIRAQKLHNIDLNTRDKKKLQKKRAQPLRNSKANRAKWLGRAERNLLIRLLTGHNYRSHTHTRTHK